MAAEEHTGTLMSGTVTCSCGWTSEHFALAADAGDAFTEHLRAQKPHLVLERKEQGAEGVYAGGQIMVTPPLDESYWSYRVRLTEKQAVVGFPKFGVIGIGYAVEDADWNSNLPSNVPAETIAAHIAENKGDDTIDDADVIAAIKLIQEAVRADAG